MTEHCLTSLQTGVIISRLLSAKSLCDEISVTQDGFLTLVLQYILLSFFPDLIPVSMAPFHFWALAISLFLSRYKLFSLLTLSLSLSLPFHLPLSLALGLIVSLHPSVAWPVHSQVSAGVCRSPAEPGRWADPYGELHLLLYHSQTL